MSEPIEVFKFHPITGNPLQKKGVNYLLDEKSDKKFFIDPKPTAHAILITPEEKIVFVIRGRDPYQGKLNLPAGFLNIKETFEEAIKREVKEEIGVQIDNIKYHGSFVNRYLFEGVNNYIIDVGFVAEINSEQVDKIKPSDDAIGFELYKLSDIPFDKVAFQSIKKSLRKFVSR